MTEARPLLLDLFCGAGGAGVGYHRAGFDVVGVDLAPQPSYPFEFVQGDAFEVGARLLAERPIAAVHASPPCQAYSALRHLPWLREIERWDSIPPTLAFLAGVSVPWVVENVERAPLPGAIKLCGMMFGLGWPDGVPLYRHRLFASNVLLLQPAHRKHTHVYENGRDRLAFRRLRGNAPRSSLNSPRTIGGHHAGLTGRGAALGIDWMTRRDEVAQAIPPAYTEMIGRQIIEAVR